MSSSPVLGCQQVVCTLPRISPCMIEFVHDGLKVILLPSRQIRRACCVVIPSFGHLESDGWLVTTPTWEGTAVSRLLTAIGETFAAISTAFASLFADETTTESGQTGRTGQNMQFVSTVVHFKVLPGTQAATVFLLTDNHLLRRTLLVLHLTLRWSIVVLLLLIAWLRGAAVSVR